MSPPAWLEKDLLLAVQEQLLARFGGLQGVRDEALLESVIARARQLFSHGSPDIFELAAAYAHGIIKNHPFVDGNKRVGFMAAYIFLGANGWDLDASEESAVRHTLALAAGEIGAEEYAQWLKQSSVEENC